MSWKSLIENEPELYYFSNSITIQDLIADINRVFNRMLERQGEDDAVDASALAIVMNVTNGFLDFVWYNPTTQKSVGTWKYQLRLQELWEITLDHQKGAAFFDDECYLAIFKFIERHLYDETTEQTHDVFVRRDFGGLNEVIL